MIENYICNSDSESISSENSGYSDKIDSDIEAELYGSIHHEANASTSLKSLFVEHCIGNKTPPPQEEQFILVQTEHENPFQSDLVFNNSLYTNFGMESGGKNINRKILSPKNNISRLVPGTSKKSLKRKSDLIANILEHIQVNCSTDSNPELAQPIKDVSSKKQKSEDDASSEILEVISDDDVQSSNSEYSVVSIDPSESNLCTNVELEPIIVSSASSDSESSDRGSKSLTVFREDSFFTSTEPSASTKDPWHINMEDQYRTRRLSNRYHETATSICSNCNLKGHLKKDCTVRKAQKCYYCGEKHAATWCKKRICGKCLNYGHSPMQCFLNFENSCDCCQMNGHLVKDCPDLWRRYHITTSGNKIIPAKEINQDSPIFCFNCGQEGHYGPNCKRPRMNKWCSPTWTSVVTYAPTMSTRTFFNQCKGKRKKISNTPANFSRSEVNFNVFPKNKELPRKKKKKKPKKKAEMQITAKEISPKKDFNFPRTPKAIASNGMNHEFYQNRRLQRKARRVERRKAKLQVLNKSLI